MPAGGRLRASIISLLLAFASDAGAGGIHPTYTLPWTGKGEILTYRSCGCADGCWVAELRELKGKRIKARLRCDCGNLLFAYPAKVGEKTMGKSCSVINASNDKQEAISQEMRRIVGGN